MLVVIKVANKTKSFIHVDILVLVGEFVVVVSYLSTGQWQPLWTHLCNGCLFLALCMCMYARVYNVTADTLTHLRLEVIISLNNCMIQPTFAVLLKRHLTAQ